MDFLHVAWVDIPSMTESLPFWSMCSLHFMKGSWHKKDIILHMPEFSTTVFSYNAILQNTFFSRDKIHFLCCALVLLRRLRNCITKHPWRALAIKSNDWLVNSDNSALSTLLTILRHVMERELWPDNNLSTHTCTSSSVTALPFDSECLDKKGLPWKEACQILFKVWQAGISTGLVLVGWERMPTSVLAGIIVCGDLKKACYNTLAYLIGRWPIIEQRSFRFLSYYRFLKPTTVTNTKFQFISKKLVLENAQRMIYSKTCTHISKAFLPWYDILAVNVILYFARMGIGNWTQDLKHVS